MARIQLRNCTIYLEDGLSGTGAVNDASGLTGGETTVDVDTLVRPGEVRDSRIHAP